MKKTILALAIIALTALQANAFSPSAVKFEIPHDKKAASLTLINESDNQEVVEIYVQKWTGIDAATGQSISEVDQDDHILLSKPIVTLKPHSKSTIRIAVRERSSADSDYYRLSVINVTIPTIDPLQNSAQLKLSFDMPLQVHNKKDAKGVLTFTTSKDGNAIAKNTGNNIVLVSGMKKSDTETVSFMRYVMPDETWKTDINAKDAAQIIWSPGLQ
jgi:P pilus assembly chaperone PapD